jgi:hypothetical protein
MSREAASEAGSRVIKPSRNCGCDGVRLPAVYRAALEDVSNKAGTAGTAGKPRARKPRKKKNRL